MKIFRVIILYYFINLQVNYSKTKKIKKDYQNNDIDIVYTWVNGSDQNWFKKMIYYKSIIENESLYANQTDSFLFNRYRDNNELKSDTSNILDIHSDHFLSSPNGLEIYTL